MREPTRFEQLEQAARELAYNLGEIEGFMRGVVSDLMDDTLWCTCNSGELSSMCCEEPESYWSWRGQKQGNVRGTCKNWSQVVSDLKAVGCNDALLYQLRL